MIKNIMSSHHATNLHRRGLGLPKTLSSSSVIRGGFLRAQLTSLVMILLLLPTTVVGIDCGCPDTCTVEALKEKNGEKYDCEKRIKFLMEKRQYSEMDACTAASKDPTRSDEFNINTPCRYEACHPEGCNKKKEEEKIAKKKPVYKGEIHNCGCPETCPNEAGEMNGSNFECQSRITFLMEKHNDSEMDACKGASKDPALSQEDNDKRPCRYETCNPEGCKKFQKEPSSSTTTKKKAPVYKGEIHNCGCPDTCPKEAGEMNGSQFECQSRITFLMEKHKDSEMDACKGASKDPALSKEDNEKRPCRYEACNPEGCKGGGGSTTTKKKKREISATEEALQSFKKGKPPAEAKASTTTASNNKKKQEQASSSSPPPPQNQAEESSLRRGLTYLRIIGMLGLILCYCGHHREQRRRGRGKKGHVARVSRRSKNNNTNTDTATASKQRSSGVTRRR